MSTTFEDLFDQFLETEIDSFDIAKYNPPQLLKYLSNLLKRSRQEVYNLLYSNPQSIANKMDDVIEFNYKEYSYNFTGTTFTQVLNPTPSENSLFYITVDDIQTTNFTYDNLTNTLIINGMLNKLNSIDVTTYISGQFNQTLTLIEQGILIDWMGVIILKDKIKTQRLYNLAIYGVDFNEKSQGAHITALQKIYKENRDAVEVKTLEYTFRNAPDKSQFGGRGGQGGARR